MNRSLWGTVHFGASFNDLDLPLKVTGGRESENLCVCLLGFFFGGGGGRGFKLLGRHDTEGCWNMI